MFGYETTNEMMVTAIERPRRLRLVSQDCHIPYELDPVIDAIHMVGTRITLSFGTRLDAGAKRTRLLFVTPASQIALRNELEQNLNDLAAANPPDVQARQHI
jgi:hypothetical protein